MRRSNVIQDLKERQETLEHHSSLSLQTQSSSMSPSISNKSSTNSDTTSRPTLAERLSTPPPLALVDRISISPASPELGNGSPIQTDNETLASPTETVVADPSDSSPVVISMSRKRFKDVVNRRWDESCSQSVTPLEGPWKTLLITEPLLPVE